MSEPDQLINPAPADTEIDHTSTHRRIRIAEENHTQSSNYDHIRSSQTRIIDTEDDIEKRDRKIKRLEEHLRIINTICTPFTQHVTFQQCMDPDIKIISDANQWAMISFALKATITGWIDDEFHQIDDPSRTLQRDMTKTLSNLNSTVEIFTNSMKEMITISQNRHRTSFNQQIPAPVAVSILDAMHKSNPQ